MLWKAASQQRVCRIITAIQGLLSTSDVMQARAERMTSRERNQKIHYEGNAVAWQGANRVEADKLDIDRTRHILEAHGKSDQPVPG